LPTIAVLALEPDQLSARYGMSSRRESDLDEANVATVQLPSGRSLLSLGIAGTPHQASKSQLIRTTIHAARNEDSRSWILITRH